MNASKSLLCNNTIEDMYLIFKEYINELPDYQCKISLLKEEANKSGICRHIWTETFGFDTLLNKNITIKICPICERSIRKINGIEIIDSLKNTITNIAETDTTNYMKQRLLVNNTIVSDYKKMEIDIKNLFSVKTNTIEYGFI